MYCIACFENWNELREVLPHFMSEEGDIFYRCDYCCSITSNPLEEILIGKKEAEAPKLTVWESKATVCQCCQYHSNNPSRCTSNGYFIGRKNEGCEIFTRKK